MSEEPRASRLARATRSWPARILGGLFVFWMFLYFHWVPENLQDAANDGSYHAMLTRGDGHYMYLATLSLVFDRDLDLKNQYQLAGDPFRVAGKIQKTGRSWIYPVGTSVLQIPFFLVAQGCALITNAFGAHHALHGYTLFHQRITFLGAVLASFFALLLGFRMARRHVSETAALYGTVVVGVGTGVLYYGVYWVSYAHAWTALGVALLLEYWDRTRGQHSARRWAILGLYTGLAALTRMQEVVFAALPAAEAIFEFVLRLRRRDFMGALRIIGYGALAGVLALVAVSPQLIGNWVIFGDLFAVHPGENYMRWSSPYLWETLYSTRNGLFIWTPLAYLALAGLLAAPRRARLGAALLGGFLLDTWVNGSAWTWWSDASFANRKFVDCTLIMILGLAFLVERLRAFHARHPRLAPHAALILALAPFVALNLELSWAVSHGYQKTGAVVSSQALYENSFQRAFKSVVESVGNPASWPASWLWAWKHHSSPGRFDQLVGGERLFVTWEAYGKKGARVVDPVRLADSLGLYGTGPWSELVHDGPATYAWAHDGARLAVPIFMPEDVHLLVRARVATDAMLVVNGHAATLSPGEMTELRIDLPRGLLRNGTNDLVFRCEDEAPSGCAAVDTVTFVYQP